MNSVKNMNNNKSVPWLASQFYKVNGIPMVYERLENAMLSHDIIMDYECGQWTVDELERAGYKVEKPKLFRGMQQNPRKWA